MALKGIDFGRGKISAKTIKDNGFAFVCRYLSTIGNPKNVTKEEIEDIRSVGLKLVLVFETTARRCVAGFGAGRTDALSAQSQVKALGLCTPVSAPVIYFACDDDFGDDEMESIELYFRGIATVLGSKYVGVYGGLAVVSDILDTGLAQYGWQTYAWSHGEWDDRVQLRQVKNGVPVLEEVECDTNEASKDDFGQT